MKNNIHYSIGSSIIQLTCLKTTYTAILDLPLNIENLFTCLENLLESLDVNVFHTLSCTFPEKDSASCWSKDPLTPSSSIHCFVQHSTRAGAGGWGALLLRFKDIQGLYMKLLFQIDILATWGQNILNMMTIMTWNSLCLQIMKLCGRKKISVSRIGTRNSLTKWGYWQIKKNERLIFNLKV